ncbi:MAG TPA: hypothetical protein DHV48_19150 [Prolixibacteraceae bacterium]|nr:hypothetical protein [Prolixibacteraceae bacterium]
MEKNRNQNTAMKGLNFDCVNIQPWVSPTVIQIQSLPAAGRLSGLLFDFLTFQSGLNIKNKIATKPRSF